MNPWHYIWYGIGWAILGSCALTIAILAASIVYVLADRAYVATRARVRRWRKPRTVRK